MFELLQRKYLELRNSEEGQTLAEYALLLALIAVIVIVAVALLGTRISSIFEYIAGNLTVGS
jgi:pilus assembly protein Flp/PilA